MRPTTSFRSQVAPAGEERPTVSDADQVFSHPLVVSASLFLLNTITNDFDNALNSSSSLAVSNWGQLTSAYTALATACSRALSHPASQPWTKLNPDRTRLVGIMQEHVRATVDVLDTLLTLGQEDTVLVLTVLGTLIPLFKCVTILHHLHTLPPLLIPLLTHLVTHLDRLAGHSTYSTRIQLPMYALRQLIPLLPSITVHGLLPPTSPGRTPDHSRGPRPPTHPTPVLPYLSRKRPRATMALDEGMPPLEDGFDLVPDHQSPPPPPPMLPSPPARVGDAEQGSHGGLSSPDPVRDGWASPVLSNVSSPIAISPRELALHSSRYICCSLVER